MAGEYPAVTGSDRSILLADQNGLTKRAVGDAEGKLLVNWGRLSGIIANVITISASLSNQTLLAIQTDRKTFCIYNDSNSNLYFKYGPLASVFDFTVKMPPHSYFESPAIVFAGRIDGVWDGNTGTAHITEII